MADIFSRRKRSEVMSLIRSKNTKPELAMRKLISSVIYPLGYRYRINYRKLPGRPDVVFVSRKIAVFVDGAFWHGYDFRNTSRRLPKKYWLPKIKRNIMRDAEISLKLRKMGWKVIRIWDHEIKETPDKALDKVLSCVKGKHTIGH